MMGRPTSHVPWWDLAGTGPNVGYRYVPRPMMGRPTSHDGTSHVPWWDLAGTGPMCVPGTGLMRLDRDETSAGTEKLSSDLQSFKDLHVCLYP